MAAIPLVEVLTRTEAYLRGRGIPSPRYEAEQLLAHALGIERLQLYLQHDRPMAEDELASLREMVGRRGKREPLAWIVGSVGFHAIELAVGPGVLVPRPDSEVLVEEALARIDVAEDPVFVADVGSGSGAIGLAIASARPGVRVFATDLSDDALACTRANVEALGLSKRVAVLRGPLLGPVPPHRKIDWVVSNPPYIPTRDLAECEPEVSQWEPKLALDGGGDGLAVYRELIPEAARRAHRGLIVEVGIRQAPHVKRLMAEHGFTDIETADDLGGVTRVVAGHRTS